MSGCYPEPQQRVSILDRNKEDSGESRDLKLKVWSVAHFYLIFQFTDI